jgi:hypothetical protein
MFSRKIDRSKTAMPESGGQEHGKSKGREEHLRRLRESLSRLESKYGLELGGPGGVDLTAEARRLQLPQPLLNNQTIVIPCQAELQDLGLFDPCLIVPSSWPVELLPTHRQLAIGGQVRSIARSTYSLPKYVMDAAWRSTQVWQGALMPVLVVIDGDEKYLVRANSWFFRLDNFRGHDIDPSYVNEPDERDLKRGAYLWSDDLSSEITLVVGKF